MLKFEKTESCVNLKFNDKTVYEFSGGATPLSFSNGENSYKMSHGSFKISEKLNSKTVEPILGLACEGNVLTLTMQSGIVTLTVERERHLTVHFEGFRNYNRLFVEIPALPNEHVYGTGEIFSEFDLRGKHVNCWVAEHINALQVSKKLVKQVFGIKNSQRKQKFSNYETYYAQPTYLSSRKYYFHSFTTARSEFDFTKSALHTVKIDEIADFCFGFGNSFEEVCEDLTQTLGRQPELPDWVYDGQIIASQGGTDEMMKHFETAKNNGLEPNAMWIQDWEGRRVTAVGKQLFWNWEWDEELYPNLPEKIKELNAQGVKVLGYCNPFLAVEKPMYKEAAEKGYCVKDKDGKDYLVTITTFPAAMVDFTNPDAYAWIKTKIKENMIDFGLSGWMADFGEYLPTDCVLYSGEDAELVHNTWPARWAKLNREVVEESGKLGEIMFFTRAGFSDTVGNSTMMWNGDNHVDFSIDFGLPSVIPAMLSLTTCGFGLSHSDVGGYTTFFNLKRSEELYMRWAEMNAFTVVMRGHEGLNPDLNAQFDASDTVLKHGAKYGKIHKALKPYLKDAVHYNAQNGVGVVRPLFFYYDEAEAYNEAYEYLLGRDILVAPVIKASADTRNVYLPDDEWVHLWSGVTYKKGHHTVKAPIGEIPVFVRKSSKYKDEFMKLKEIGG